MFREKVMRKWGGASLAVALAIGGMGLASAPPAWADDAQAGSDASSELVNWTKLYGSTGSSSLTLSYCDRVNDAASLVEGGTVAVGCFDGNKVEGVEGAKGGRDAFVAQTDAAGGAVWQTLVGGSKTDYFNAVAQTRDGGIVAVGASQSSDGDFAGKGKGGYDGSIALLSADGELLKTATLGGSDKDELYDVTVAQDGGYVVVGQFSSEDGDLASVEHHGSSDAVIAKFDAELNLLWVKTLGGSGADRLAEVAKNPDGGYAAVGYTEIAWDAEGADGDIAYNAGGQDALVVKFDAEGNTEWIKTFGGAEDDVAASITRAPLEDVELSDDEGGERPQVDPEQVDGGYIIAGTAASADGTLSEGKTSAAGTDSAYLLKIDAQGDAEWINVLETSVEAYGDAVVVSDGNYVMSGAYEGSDLDFTGQQAYGANDLYVATFSPTGDYLGMSTVGGTLDDRSNGTNYPNGMILDSERNYLLFGATASADGPFSGMQGKVDGFLLNLNASVVETFPGETYLVPVTAWHASEDRPSMMAPMLHEAAFVEKTGEQYVVTFYFTNAEIMGSQVNASTLGAVSYERDGELVPADSDSYDATTQVKTCTITLDSLDENVGIHIEDAMGDIRLHFDPADAVESDTPPYFEPVQVTQPDFETSWKVAIGGSSTDYANSETVLSDGTVVVGGQAYSYDGEFAGRPATASSAFLSAYSQSGELLSARFLSAAEPYTNAYVASVDAAGDGGFFAGGSYQLDSLTSLVPSGDFADLAQEDGAYGENDGYVARFDASMNLVWMRGFSGSGHDQVKSVKATPDGGMLAVIETASSDGDMTDLNKGLFDLVVVKYDAAGNVVWTRAIGGKNIESTDAGIDLLASGNVILAGYTCSGSGDFEGTDYFGDLFDLFAAELDASTGEVKWLRTYGGDKSDYLSSVTATSDGGFVLSGGTSSSTGTFAGANETAYNNAYLLKCDASGNAEWSRFVTSTENSEAKRVVELADGYAMIGDSRGTNLDFQDLNKGSMDVFVAMFNKQGVMISLETIGGTLGDYSADLVAINDYQLGALVYGESSDGDFAASGNVAGGNEFSSMLLAFDYREKPVDFAALQQLVDEAGSLVEADYTPESWSSFATRLQEAREVLANADATQEDVDQAAAMLDAARDALVEAVAADLDELRAFVDKVDGLDPALYTPESWSAFSEALAAAQALLVDDATTQDQADAALASLQEAYGALMRADVDTQALEELVSKAEGLKASDYSQGTWADLEAALEAAREVLADPQASQSDVDDALAALQAAIDDLQKADGGNVVPSGGDRPSGDSDRKGASGGNGLSRTGDPLGAVAAGVLVSAVAAGGTAVTLRMRRRGR